MIFNEMGQVWSLNLVDHKWQLLHSETDIDDQNNYEEHTVLQEHGCGRRCCADSIEGDLKVPDKFIGYETFIDGERLYVTGGSRYENYRYQDETTNKEVWCFHYQSREFERLQDL